jgi:SAM-dependent methyltransferase
MAVLRRWKIRADALHFATPWIAGWAARQAGQARGRELRVLDVGMGAGRDLLAIRARVGAGVKLYGVESQPALVDAARAAGIRTFAVDLERERLPAEDGFFDLVVANHVIEHLKELPWFFSEVGRVLAPGGIVIVGWPNLASWHNRLMLLLGRQPACMKILGPHVRGMTRSGLRQFLEHGGYFEAVAAKGSNFYPVPILWLNRALAAILPGMSASAHLVARRTVKRGSFLDVLDSGILGMGDTPYFRGVASAGKVNVAGSERV